MTHLNVNDFVVPYNYSFVNSQVSCTVMSWIGTDMIGYWRLWNHIFLLHYDICFQWLTWTAGALGACGQGLTTRYHSHLCSSATAIKTTTLKPSFCYFKHWFLPRMNHQMTSPVERALPNICKILLTAEAKCTELTSPECHPSKCLGERNLLICECQSDTLTWVPMMPPNSLIYHSWRNT